MKNNKLLKRLRAKNSKSPYSAFMMFLFFALFLTVQNMYSQDKTITGNVSGQAGNLLPGVTILEKGTNNGVITDFDGNYDISVANSASILVFSFIGMETQEVSVGEKTVINLALLDAFNSLDEVIVTGYGTQSTRKLTGSIASLDLDDVKDQPVANALQSMQGQMAGVQINQSSGAPGEGMSIRIRGAISIGASNAPLYVVDGLPIVGDINDISPNEIESMSVLKGSAAASLYGSRAANGVVLVTTKQAKIGEKAQISVDITTGIGSIPKNLLPDVLNAQDFVTHMSWFWEDRVKYQNGDPNSIPEIFRNPEAYDGPDTNWYDELLQTSTYQDYSFSIRSGTNNLQSSVVATFHDEKGTVINSDYKRISLRANTIYTASDHVRVGINIAPNFVKRNGNNTDGRYNILWTAVVSPPIFDPNQRDPDGSLIDNFVGAPAPLWSMPNPKNRLIESTDTSESIQILSNAYVEIDFLKDFMFKSSIGVDYTTAKSRTYNPSNVGLAPWHFNLPRIAEGDMNQYVDYTWNFENSFSYSKTINNNHNINAIVIYSSQETRSEGLWGDGNTFANDELPWIEAATNRDAGSWVTDWSLISMIGKLNYDYKGKYLLQATFRRDGSSRFGSENRWGSFPSVSLGWVLSEEKFMENASTISFLKLRGEYGKSGNFNIGDYSHLGATGARNYVFNGAVNEGVRQTSIGNNRLTWETSVGSGIGFDLGLVNDRFRITFDYYKKTTDGLLYEIDIPSSNGFLDVVSNIGQFDFWGYEFSLMSKNLVKGDLKWTTNFNMSFDRNKTIKLGTNNEALGGGGGTGIGGVSNKTEVGQPINQFWGFVSDGVYENQEDLDNSPSGPDSLVGGVKWKDIDGSDDFTNDDRDRAYIGNPQPDFVFGFSNFFTYKKFDFSLVLTGAVGHDMQYGFLEWTWLLDGLFNVEQEVLGRWRSPENPGDGVIPGSAQNRNWRVNSDLITYDASYLNVKNFSIGYILPNVIGLKALRIYGTVQNLYTFTNYPGVNPEATNLGNPHGVDNGSYPISRTFALGLNLTF